ncbi:MAG: Peptidoglycan O-acetyltransferase [Pseudomonadota bacterium]|jgi:D-alanyl-lipoteichoic acid acyltransferase DltB (MBOAT superfamily)
MQFNSLVFVAFLAVVLAVWWTVSLRAGRMWLLLASLVFYGWWSPSFLALLVATATLDWAVALAMDRPEVGARRRTTLLIVSIVVNLGTLVVFKYAGFVTREVQDALARAGVTVAWPTLAWVLPVGISFYTFQAMAYTVDVYRRQVRPFRELADFLLFITFFPQLVAGPIERGARLAPQLLAMRRPDGTQLARAPWLIAWGFFKKLVVADNLAPVVAAGFESDSPTGACVVVAAYAFTWQIYADFSGYSDIARGVALLFGVELMENFRRPFLAASPRELWQRWHVSLSEWFRDYVYVPLGGNRRAEARNLLGTMVLAGLWHGANWTFALWGAWHGAALVLGRRLPSLPGPRAVRVLATFHVLMLGFVVFRAHDLAHLARLASRLRDGGGVTPLDASRAGLLALLAGVVLAVELVQERASPDTAVRGVPWTLQAGVFAVLVALITVLGSTYGVRFLYFQF